MRNDSQLSARLAGGGLVTFACGRKTILLSRPKTISTGTVIDGGGSACWRGSYAGLLPEPVIDLFDEDSARDLWRQALEMPRAGSVGIVAEVPDRGVVGVMRIGSNPDEPSWGHAFSLYVRPTAQGLGVGGSLLGEAERRFRAAGQREATLWVFAANVAAVGFCGHHGWQPDGVRRVEPEYGEPELRLRKNPGRVGWTNDGGE